MYFNAVILDEARVRDAFKDLDFVCDVLYRLVVVWLEANLKQSADNLELNATKPKKS